MRARSGVATVLVVAAFLGGVAACGFGVDLDGLFGDRADGGGASEASVDGGGDGGDVPEAGIPSIEILQLAAGGNHTCGRRIDGTVMCWGEDGPLGYLGDGAKFSSSTPVLVKDVADAIDLAVGPSHSCVVRRGGAVSCWGENAARQLGDGTTTSSPTLRAVLSLADVKQVALGSTSSCALKTDGTVQCWGDNTTGQLGDGSVISRSQPAPITGVVEATQVAAIDATACVLTKVGDVLCWGRNSVGQAGVAPGANVLTPTKVAGLSGVTSIGLGNAGHFCAVQQSGAILCWGGGGFGSLGNAKTDNNATPVTVLSVSDALGVAMGGGHSCAWRKSGAVACWGLNDWRQLGIGDTTTTNVVSSPLPVEVVTGVKQVVGGSRHSCALLSDGKRVSCWGSNVGGALGRGTRVVSDVPVKVATSSSLASLALGGSHSCAVDAAGLLSCWGSNDYAQYLAKTFLASGTPAAVAEVSGVSRAACGDNHTCVVAGGGVQCWGLGQYGRLGNGSSPYIQSTPVTFIAPPATDVGAASARTCALLTTKEVACTGDSTELRLGFDSGGSDVSTPALITPPAVPDAGAEAGPTPLGATKMAIGRGHSCVLRAGGIVTCWGSNGSGQCGVAGAGARLPVDVPVLTNIVDIAPGDAHTCALLQDGSVRCWGDNGSGQTTGATPSGPSLRTPELGGKTAKAIAAGASHSCALATDGTVLCWGRGSLGQLGNGIRSDTPTPVVVKNLATTVKSIAARGDRTCALLDDGSAYCWGQNRIGELGDGVVMTTGLAAPIVGY